MSEARAAVEAVDRMTHEVIREALAEASGVYWERRAQQFEAARPRRSDFNGRATIDDWLARSQRCTEIARACRARGRLESTRAIGAELDDALVDAVLVELDQFGVA